MAFLRSDNPKTTSIRIRVTDTDKDEIQLAARKCHLSASEYMLRAALGRQTRSKHDLHQINELRRITSTLRDIYFGAAPVNDERLQPVLAAAVHALNQLANEQS